MAKIRKALKDEFGVKKCAGPYLLFVKEQWKKERAMNVPFSQYSKEISNKWQNMGEEEKRIWQEKAALEKDNYEKEMARLRPMLCKPVKKPRTPYIFFCMDKRHQVTKDHPNNSFTEVSKILGKMWSKLTASEKGKYVKMAELDKKRYYTQMGRTRKVVGVARTSPPDRRRRNLGTRKRRASSKQDQPSTSTSDARTPNSDLNTSTKT